MANPGIHLVTIYDMYEKTVEVIKKIQSSYYSAYIKSIKLITLIAPQFTVIQKAVQSSY